MYQHEYLRKESSANNRVSTLKSSKFSKLQALIKSFLCALVFCQFTRISSMTIDSGPLNAHCFILDKGISHTLNMTKSNKHIYKSVHSPAPFEYYIAEGWPQSTILTYSSFIFSPLRSNHFESIVHYCFFPSPHISYHLPHFSIR